VKSLRLRTLTSEWLLLLTVSIFLALPVSSTVVDDESPAVSWSKTYSQFSTGGQAYANCIIQTSDGGYAVIVDAWQTKTSNYGCLLLKLDANGNVEWNKTFSGINDLACPAIVQSSDGGYAVAGFTSKTTTDPLGHSVFARFFWFTKTDSEGNVQWTKLYGSP
jgi:hypothetical protein